MRMLAIALAALAGACLPADGSRQLARLSSGRTDRRRAPTGPRRLKEGLHVCVLSWRGARATQRRRTEVVELCQSLSAELQAGASPRAALAAAAQGVAEFDQLAAVAASPYGDVSGALAALASTRGRDGLARVATCWQLCERNGVGLAVAIGRLAEALRDDEQVRRETAAQVAGPRATGVLLALLPIFGVAMGSALGAAPLRLLFQSSLGLMLLASAALLEVVGLLWMARITRRVLPR